MRAEEIIRKPLHTEKSVADIQANNQYHFEVAPHATKTQVREAIEAKFPGVKVRSVNTERVKGKMRRYRHVLKRTRQWKKAIVELRAGDHIDIGY